MLDKTRDKEAHRSLKVAISDARDALISEQQADGHWVYHLEADCTIPAEYILMNHFVDEIDDELESKISNGIFTDARSIPSTKIRRS